MTTSLLVSIDYDEGDAGSYRAVRLITAAGEEVERWASESPTRDWESYLAWADKNPETPVKIASSVSHFLWDVPSWTLEKNEKSQDVLVPNTWHRGA